MRRFTVHLALKTMAPLMIFPPARVVTEAIVMFLCALVGKGGGSGWDSRGQARALTTHILPRDDLVIFDIGANNGAWSLNLFEHLSQYKPQFHLFECAPYCFPHLEARVEFMPGAVVNQKAVSDHVGEMTLYLPETGSGLASAYQRTDTSVVQHKYQEMLVPTITIDAYMKQAGLDRIDVLKVDVEGHESAVFNGAKQAFANGRIGTVMFEFGSANINSRTFFRDFWSFFVGNGYQLKRIIPSGRVIEIERYDDSLEYFRGCSNFIATPKWIPESKPHRKRLISARRTS